MTLIATATNTTGEPIEVGGGPGSGRGPGLIAVTPDGKTAYVVIVGHPGAVVPIATATNTPGPPIEIGNHPDGIVITPDGKTVYVANINSGTVTPIATAANTAGEPIEVGVRPRAIAVTPDGKTAYVVNQSRPQPPPLPHFPSLLCALSFPHTSLAVPRIYLSLSHCLNLSLSHCVYLSVSHCLCLCSLAFPLPCFARR